MNDTPKQSWWQRLSGGLKRTSASIGSAISDLVSKRKLDAATVEELEELLIRADLGVDTAARIAAAIGEGRYDKQVSEPEVKAILAAEVEKVLSPVAKPLVIDARRKAVRHSGGRRQRLGQDHHHRQARGALPHRGPQGRARGRRHVPRRRDRAAEDLGQPHRRDRDRERARVGRREPCVRGLDRGAARRRRRADRRYRGPAAEQVRADGRAGEGRARDEEGRSGRAARGAARARRDRRAERAVAGGGILAHRGRDRAW